MIGLFGSSCTSRKNLTYLKRTGISKEHHDNNLMYEEIDRVTEYRIMPYDHLYISVISPDPQWSSIFNTVSEEDIDGYAVDNQGYVDIPFVGKVEVKGKSLNEVKDILKLTFSNYVKDASITVRLVNNHISIIGEVETAGRYLLTKDRINIFEALALAGDLSEYGNRKKVQLVRPTQYGPVVKELSLSDQSIFTSEYYYVMPNDVVYVPPQRGRTFQMNVSIYMLVFSLLNTAAVVYTLVQSN